MLMVVKYIKTYKDYYVFQIMRFIYIFFFINVFLTNIFLLTKGYVLRSDVNGRNCDINFSKDILNIKFDKGFCDDVEYNKYNLFKFNNCNNLKKTVTQGIELWSKNNNHIKYNIINDITSNKNNKNNKNNIDVIISFKNLNDKKIGEAYRECNIKLNKAYIYLNKKNCYYPDNFFCLYNKLSFILLFISIILTHFIIHLFILYIFEKIESIIESTIESIYYYGCIFPCFIINTVGLIYIHINCNDCIPIKNVIAHEFGHILGFGHLDEYKSKNWDGYVKNCIVEKKINEDYDIKSIMISNSNFLRFIKGISENDKLGLYDLYPNCIYNPKVYDNFEYINEDVYKILLLMLYYLCLSIIIPIIFLFIVIIYNKYNRNINVNEM